MANYVLIIIFQPKGHQERRNENLKYIRNSRQNVFYVTFICLDKYYKGLLRCLHEMFEEPKSIMKEIWAQFLFLWEIVVRT